ncbi:hypothetical protein FOPG_11906 [Fusarium oxysporum f. sp. conglutinans race 2 54008]|uniref:Uncharacterized protein n=2 Tax=Fusarium oxysporum TaxID=5507 RepID=X0M6R5_FUSOX|nr:hypothetical protein FOPG_11906 [Fusarium oxysporum f. sp. conglutinans race 2 54008]EXM16330.1 hypothetical protein FOTG_15340 [Fusarium oxysporum f. sp. vasinfectum 25433]
MHPSSSRLRADLPLHTVQLYQAYSGISCRSRLTTNIITSQPPLYALANGSAPINHHQETQDAQHHNVQPHADMQPSCNAHGAYKRGFCTVYIPYLVFSVKCV